MDHIGKQARVESALLVQQKMKEIGENLPAILTGDFNVDQTHRSYLALTESGIPETHSKWPTCVMRPTAHSTVSTLTTTPKAESTMCL